ncbi:cxxc_20_cxxc protein [Clostridium sp. DSM 8431]|uniref:hypothetical protein n=1 Tax=Clostridium sp. DSM 8431 TaxID=1761781 RepID=UPI0008E71CD2|nr:hypothetical protein [Clostridium sp. DSM 8431]SFU76245.1 cxxc_20_cxxc protein [Clostridium sp. DSM 8431]
MNRQCERCKFRIDTRDILKKESKDKIICPNCGRTLVATKLSKTLAFSVFIMFFLVFLLLPINFIYITIVEIVWSFITYNILPALLYEYEEIKEDVEK